MAPDWLLIAQTILLAAAVELPIALWNRRVIIREVDRRSTAKLDELVARVVVDVRGAVAALLPSAPSVEEQEAARAALAASIAEQVQAVVPAAAEAAIAEAVKGRMSALSSAGVEARQSNAAMEWAFKQAVGKKGGLKAVLALNLMPKAMLKAGAEAFALAPESFDAWWDENGPSLLGGGAAKPKVNYIGGGR